MVNQLTGDQSRPAYPPGVASSATGAAPARPRRLTLRLVLGVTLIVAVNVLMYALLATGPAQRAIDALAGWTYPGVFVLSLVANAGIFVPVPYNAIVLQVAASADLPWLVAVAAAAGSALGETTGWLVGRKGGAVLPGEGRAGRAVAWIRRTTRSPVRAFAAIATFAAIPNYVFDAAGLASGALGVRYPVFLAATFTGRLLRFAVFAAAGPWLLASWSALWS